MTTMRRRDRVMMGSRDGRVGPKHSPHDLPVCRRSCTGECFGLTISGRLKAPVLNHEAAALDDLDACTGELFGDEIVLNAGLEPDRVGARSEQIIKVIGQLLATAENINQIDRSGNIGKAMVNRLAQNRCDILINDRYWNDFEAHLGKGGGHIVSRTISGAFGANPQHGNAADLTKQVIDLRGRREDEVLPIHERYSFV